MDRPFVAMREAARRDDGAVRFTHLIALFRVRRGHVNKKQQRFFVSSAKFARMNADRAGSKPAWKIKMQTMTKENAATSLPRRS